MKRARGAAGTAAAMEKQGFTVFPSERWHFHHRNWRRYAIQNVRFEDL